MSSTLTRLNFPELSEQREVTRSYVKINDQRTKLEDERFNIEIQMKGIPRSGICKNKHRLKFINTGGRLLKARNTKELEFTLYFVLQADLSRKIHDNHRKDC